MRRLARWTLNALTALSLLLCVAAVGLWIWTQRSYAFVQLTRQQVSTDDGFPGGSAWYVMLDCSGGEIELSWSTKDDGPPSVPMAWRTFVTSHVDPPAIDLIGDLITLRGGPTRTVANRVGFGATWCVFPPGVIQRRLAFPCWSAALIFGCLPLARWHSQHRARRQPGLCPGCGYDMRATPAKCPEAGGRPTDERPPEIHRPIQADQC